MRPFYRAGRTLNDLSQRKFQLANTILELCTHWIYVFAMRTTESKIMKANDEGSMERSTPSAVTLPSSSATIHHKRL